MPVKLELVLKNGRAGPIQSKLTSGHKGHNVSSPTWEASLDKFPLLTRQAIPQY